MLWEVTDIPPPVLYVIFKKVSGFFHNDGYLSPAEIKMHTSLFVCSQFKHFILNCISIKL